MIGNRLFSIISVTVILGFVILTGFQALQEGVRTRDFIRDHEMRPLGMALAANLDRTAAYYHQVGQELLRDGFLRDWIISGEQDEKELRNFLEAIRSRYGMMDASIVSNLTETYYGTDGRTLVLDPSNQERDGWYYLYRDMLVETNIDSWYFPEKDKVGIWINVPILAADGSFLGVTGGGVLSEEFTETLYAFGTLPGINVYMARQDGQLVYASDTHLLQSGTNIDDLWKYSVRELLADAHPDHYVLREPQGINGPILWISYSEDWNTYMVLEKTGEVVFSRIRTTAVSSIIAGSLLTISFSFLTLVIVRVARKRIRQQTLELEILAGQDALTSLSNRLRFNDIILDELDRIGRTGEDSCLVLLDLDSFKSINDTYGHPTGDAVLIKIAGVIRDNLRKTDYAARFGGEEFALLLPGTDLDGAWKVAEKIRLAITMCKFDGEASLVSITASFGVASLDKDRASDTRELLHQVYSRADKALYRAKDNGKNRVELSTREIKS
ncbi:sensor domain-containing diguanylate cyclase [Spirochaeta africana]|uniref:diguanylate cyclase n=1 Tax=Spirochaeta africana (strain ATCC 700263 / DSM 8902 / Z-7692) TaxID=889378 RepID=H9UG04_SPIAZ|nr:diguanylate cyclase [Spirochaeta africana]AFG36447.1 diguanylate cyclase (GGDEF) domain-containing protein [Spirochaeta africana DSM 8902]